MRLVVFNEAMMMIVCYHLFTFTKAVDFEMNNLMGFSFAYLIIFLAIFNLAVLVTKNVNNCFRQKRMVQERALYIEALKKDVAKEQYCKRFNTLVKGKTNSQMMQLVKSMSLKKANS